MLRVISPVDDDLDAAELVWASANVARGLPPSPDRTARVREKLRTTDALVLVAIDDRRPAGVGRSVVGMVLAEPARADSGSGAVISGAGHLSMLFVSPERQRAGVGTLCLSGLHRAAAARGWTRLTVWTRASNTPALRLYRSAGYWPTGRDGVLADGDAILQLANDDVR